MTASLLCSICGDGPFGDENGIAMHKTIMHSREWFDLVCDWCSTEFKSPMPYSKYCSPDCKKARGTQRREASLAKKLEARRQRTKRCVDCDAEFAAFWGWTKRCPACRGPRLTKDQFAAVLESQLNKCLVCGKLGTTERGYGKFVPDHCHETGRFRGILCWRCNQALGFLDDSLDSLSNAIEYLKGNLETETIRDVARIVSL